jgi:hypothetical protein
MVANHEIRVKTHSHTHKKIKETLKQHIVNLVNEVRKWKYKTGKPHPIEIKWIVHSYIMWKNPAIDPEELFTSMTETDPSKIVKIEREGPVVETQLDQNTIRKLYKLLQELENLDFKLEAETFSKNWERRKETGATKGIGMKKGKPKPPQKQGKVGKVLSAFFGINSY